MQITVTTADGDVYPLDISEDLPLEGLKALLSMEMEMDPKEMVLFHNMAPLSRDKDSLTSLGVRNGDMLMVMHTSVLSQLQAQSHSQTTGMGTGPPTTTDNRREPLPWQQEAMPRSTEDIFSSPETLIQHILSNPEELGIIRRRDPNLAEALASGDNAWINQALTNHRQKLNELEKERLQLEQYDPMSAEYQARLAENIRQRNIQENIEAAIEFNPEIFAGEVNMLYLECKINDTTVRALVDTGAQMTVMSEKCAERCGIMRLVDRRQTGFAFGVGRQRIIGVVHLGQIQVGGMFLATSFRVLEDQSHELIFGLDMLKRHQCVIDLSCNVLRVGTTGTETKFLSDTEVKELATVYQQELQGALEDEDKEMASVIAQSEQEYQNRTGQAPPISPPPRPPPTYSEDSIRQITSAGFSHQQAVDALRENNGDAQKALAMLLARLLTF
jgi:DNA damage-inducible protein 1